LDITEKSYEVIGALERRINDSSSIKLKMENNGDVDVAVISKISPGFDITVCGGIKITEHTQAFIEEQLQELYG